MLVTINRKNIGEWMLEYQLELINKKPLDIIDCENWRFEWTLTRQQYSIFKDVAVKQIKKTFKCNKTRAVASFDWFYENFGLRIKN